MTTIHLEVPVFLTYCAIVALVMLSLSQVAKIYNNYLGAKRNKAMLDELERAAKSTELKITKCKDDCKCWGCEGRKNGK